MRSSFAQIPWKRKRIWRKWKISCFSLNIDLDSGALKSTANERHKVYNGNNSQTPNFIQTIHKRASESRIINRRGHSVRFVLHHSRICLIYLLSRFKQCVFFRFLFFFSWFLLLFCVNSERELRMELSPYYRVNQMNNQLASKQRQICSLKTHGKHTHTH